MRIGKIVLRLRYKQTSFGNFIGGAAELDSAMKNTLTRNMAFVIPLVENAEANKYDSEISQGIVERFGVIVALYNDITQKDKTGITAYDQLHDIREELFKALIGWEIDYSESRVYYRGGKLIDMNAAYLWYQFEFEYLSRLGVVEKLDNGTSEYGLLQREVDDTEDPTSFDSIYANYILSPSADLPYTEELPLPDGFPDVSLPNMAQWIDLTENPNSGAFAKGFASGFNFYKE